MTRAPWSPRWLVRLSKFLDFTLFCRNWTGDYILNSHPRLFFQNQYSNNRDKDENWTGGSNHVERGQSGVLIQISSQLPIFSSKNTSLPFNCKPESTQRTCSYKVYISEHKCLVIVTIYLELKIPVKEQPFTIYRAYGLDRYSVPGCTTQRYGGS